MTAPQVFHQFRAALERHDVTGARELARRHGELRAQINEPVFAFDSPAIVAFARDAALVELLLELGADPNARSRWKMGPFHTLHSATGASAARLIAAGATPDACGAANLDDVALMRRMLSAEPARVHERGGDGQTPLHFARSREMIDLLLSAGADIDARDADHRATPAEWMLERSADAGRYQLARYLVEQGARTDVFLAAALGLTGQLQMMLQERPELLDLRTGQGAYGEKPPSSFHIYFWSIGAGLSPIEVAAQFGHTETARAMLQFATPLQRLLFACTSGDEEQARAIAGQHPQLVATMPAQHHAALATAAWNSATKAVALMLELGFDPAATGQDGGTALHLAAWEGGAEMVRSILAHPSAPRLLTVRDSVHGATPLGWCCHGSLHGNRKGDHASVARLLIAAGARAGSDSAHASAAVAKAFTDAGLPAPTPP